MLWHCWLGGRNGIRPVKNCWWWGAGGVICLEHGADLHMAQRIPLPLTVSCSSKIQIGFTFLVPAHPGSPGQRAVKRVCVICRLMTGVLWTGSDFISWKCSVKISWMPLRSALIPRYNTSSPNRNLRVFSLSFYYPGLPASISRTNGTVIGNGLVMIWLAVTWHCNCHMRDACSPYHLCGVQSVESRDSCSCYNYQEMHMQQMCIAHVCP